MESKNSENLKKMILQKITIEELNKKMNETITSFNGFITKEIAIKLIAKDLGIVNKDEEKVYKIKDIPKNGRGITLTAKIERIMPEIVYPSGKRSRSMVLSDETGFITLKLWEKYTKIFDVLKLEDVIKVSGAYSRNGELGLGYKSKMKLVTSAPFVDFDKLPEKEYINIRGFVKTKIGYGYYEPERKAKKYFDFELKSEDNKTVMCRLEFGPTRADKLEIGDEVILEHAYVKQNIIKIFSTTRMRKKSVGGIIEGKITEIKSIGNDKVILDVIDNNESKKILNIPKNDFYELTHITVNDDINLSTILELNKKYLIGKTFIFKKEYLESKDSG